MQGMTEGVANLTTRPRMAELGHGIVRLCMAEGVANSTTLTTGWQN